MAVDGGSTASYVYDALGRRVRKAANGTTYDYLYDLGGNVIETLDNNGSGLSQEVYAGSMHLATYGAIMQNGVKVGMTVFNYSAQEGTERLRADAAGNPVETCTNLPFGDAPAADGLDCA